MVSQNQRTAQGDGGHIHQECQEKQALTSVTEVFVELFTGITCFKPCKYEGGVILGSVLSGNTAYSRMKNQNCMRKVE